MQIHTALFMSFRHIKENSCLLTNKFNLQKPENCYHIKCKDMAGQVYCYYYYYVRRYQLPLTQQLLCLQVQ
jgi:hypothetical protein